MISEFLYDIDIEIKARNMKVEYVINQLELLECNPSLISMLCNLVEAYKHEVVFYSDEKLEADEDFSEDIVIVLDMLSEMFGEQIEDGSKFQIINRNSLSSVSWVREDLEWKTYQDIDGNYGFGAANGFEEEDYDEDYNDEW